MQGEQSYKLLTLSDGQQCLVSGGPVNNVKIVTSKAKVIDEQDLPITREQFDDLSSKVNTHLIKFDTISQSLTLELKDETQSMINNQVILADKGIAP